MPVITLPNGETVELPYGEGGGEPAWMDLMRRDLLGLEQPPPPPEMPSMATLELSETPLGQGAPSGLPAGLAPSEASQGPPQVDVAPLPGEAPEGLVNLPAGGQPGTPRLPPKTDPNVPLAYQPGANLLQPDAGPDPNQLQPPATPQEGIAVGSQAELRGIRDQYGARMAQADAVAKGKADLAREQGEQIIDREKLAEENAAELKALSDGLEQERQQIMNATQDPKRFWKNASTTSKIGMAIQVIGSGLTRRGGPNEGLQMMEKIMNRDLEAQVQELENQKYGLEKGFNLYGLNLRRLKDKEAALKETQAMGLKQIATQIEAEAAKYDSDIIAGEMLKVSGQAFQKARMLDLEATGKIWDIKKTQEAIAASKSRRGLERARFKWEKKRQEKIDSMPKGVDPELAIFDPEDPNARVIGYAQRKEVAEDVREKLDGYYNFRRQLEAIKEKAAEYGKVYQGAGADKFWQTPQGTELIAMYEGLSADYIRAISGAQVNEGEAQRLRKALPPPQSFTSANPERAWDAFLRKADMSADRAVRSAGIPERGYKPAGKTREKERGLRAEADAAKKAKEKAAKQKKRDADLMAKYGKNEEQLMREYQAYRAKGGAAPRDMWLKEYDTKRKDDSARAASRIDELTPWNDPRMSIP